MLGIPAVCKLKSTSHRAFVGYTPFGTICGRWVWTVPLQASIDLEVEEARSGQLPLSHSMAQDEVQWADVSAEERAWEEELVDGIWEDLLRDTCTALCPPARSKSTE